MPNVTDVVDLVFADADAAHRQHLATESYAEHMALGSFYEDVRDAADALAEALIAMDQTLTVEGKPILDRLRESFVTLGELREVCEDIPGAQNLFDDISSTYLSAIYKLSRLK